MSITVVSSNINKSANTIELYRGQSKTFEVSVRDSSGQPVDLLGALLYFSVKRTVEDQTPQIRKSTVLSAEAEILSPTDSGKARIYLIPSDTAVLDPGEYLFDVWVQLATGKRYPIIEVSKFIIKAGVTVL